MQETLLSALPVTELDSTAYSAWNRFVSGHSDCSIFHTNHWRRYLETAFPHIRGHFLVITDPFSQEILAGLPVYEVRSWILGTRLVSVPYANWCQPLVSNQLQFNSLLRGVMDLAERLGVNSARIHLKNSVPDLSIAPWHQESPWLHHWIDLRVSAEQLCSNFSRTAVRQLIRKAERAPIEVSSDHSEATLSSFHHLHSETRCRLGLPPIPCRTLLIRGSILGWQSQNLLLARSGSELLGGVILLIDGKEAHLEYAAQSVGAVNSGAMQLLYWRAIQLACDSGCSLFSFGRTAQDNTGLIAYKRRWNTKEEDLPLISYNSRANNKPSNSLNRAQSLVSGIIKISPLPISRMVGAYLYRHW